MATENIGLETPRFGLEDWHIPLNSNFAQLETLVEQEADRLGVSITPDYPQPPKGEPDWGRILNENFSKIENDISGLASETVQKPTVGGYANIPIGAVGWNVLINENFIMVDTDLFAIQQSDPITTDPPGPTGETYIYMTDEMLQEKKALINNGVQPYVSAFNVMVNKAEQAMTMNMRSVVDDDGDHFYNMPGNSSPYPDREAMRAMAGGARDCALAYKFTDEERYARRAIDIIHHWCLDPDTYMYPRNDTREPVHPYNRLGAMWFAASMLRGHPYWDNKPAGKPWTGGSASNAEEAFKDWLRYRGSDGESYIFQGYYNALPGYGNYNNKYMWMCADMAAVGSYLQDDGWMREAADVWRAVLNRWITLSDGRTRYRPWHDLVNSGTDEAYFKHERNRHDSFGYMRYNMNAMTCTMMAHQYYNGLNLWDYNAPKDNRSGSTAIKVYKHFAPYVQDVQAYLNWIDNFSIVPDQTMSRYTVGSVNEAAGIYEAAVRHWPNIQYLQDAVLNPDFNTVSGTSPGRVRTDGRHIGHWTLVQGAL